MVTTRRGAQRQDNAEALQGAGPSTVSQRGRGGPGRGRGGRGRSAAQAAPAAAEASQSQHVDEAAAHVGTSQQDAGGTLPEPLADKLTTEKDPADGSAGDQQANPEALEPVTGEGRKGTPESLDEGSESDSEGVGHVDAGPGREKAQEARDESGGSDSEGAGVDNVTGDDDSDDDDSDDDSDDEALFGPNLMDQLASSLKDALQARADSREAMVPAQQSGSDGQKLGLASNPDAIRWQPEVEGGKVLGKGDSKRVALGAGAAKEKGLASQLLAPPRVKASEREPSLEASKRWFQLPTTKITDEVKQELRLLRLRGAYDPKRFYKSFDETKFPKHFQIGTVMDNPQDFYSSRLTSRERGTSITQELLADPAVAAARKKRYAKLQAEATRYQKVKKRKTDLVRANPKPKRPKH
ncbi:hypothetical protein PLESTB_000452200 [Pleodorina starrii]|uniref:Fcf2 pre-rRNA processing C-terminal domain-containing protein n=1 Tax=Pleodorina starrii TaxID=330485 RepID=A0A9W6F0C3_9CHLO|nr:hypothetical protein PLESTM_000753600 [Pleodorina starrii]GLC50971.1 hypothetical protein PLESTB_000452200 [Pleodorina starrii]